MSSKSKMPRRGNRRRRRTQGSSAAKAARASHPPSFSSSLITRKTFRYQFTSAGNAVVTNGSPTSYGPGMALAMAVTTTSLTSLYTAFKIQRIKIWAPPASNLVPVTTTLIWGSANSTAFTSAGSAQKTVSDTSIGSAVGAFISSRPPKNSPAAFWQRPTTANQIPLFELQAPINTIVDIVLSLQNDMNADATPTTVTIAGPANVGEVYGSLIETAGLLSPVGIKNIT